MDEVSVWSIEQSQPEKPPCDPRNHHNHGRGLSVTNRTVHIHVIYSNIHIYGRGLIVFYRTMTSVGFSAFHITIRSQRPSPIVFSRTIHNLYIIAINRTITIVDEASVCSTEPTQPYTVLQCYQENHHNHRQCFSVIKRTTTTMESASMWSREPSQPWTALWSTEPSQPTTVLKCDRQNHHNHRKCLSVIKRTITTMDSASVWSREPSQTCTVLQCDQENHHNHEQCFSVIKRTITTMGSASVWSREPSQPWAVLQCDQENHHNHGQCFSVIKRTITTMDSASV